MHKQHAMYTYMPESMVMLQKNAQISAVQHVAIYGLGTANDWQSCKAWPIYVPATY